MKTVHISTVSDLLADVTKLQPKAVLSIESPDVEGSEKSPRLIDDEAFKHITQRIQIYNDVEDPGIYKAPQLKLVGAGVRFLLKYAAGRRPVIVHDRTGKTCAPALALAFMVSANPDKSIKQCIAHLKQSHKSLAPNLLVIQHADQMLDLKGALKQAILDDADFTRAREQANTDRASIVVEQTTSIIQALRARHKPAAAQKTPSRRPKIAP